VTTTANQWETLSFVMTDAGTYTTVVVFPHGRTTVTADTVMYMDDLTFPAFSGTGTGTGTINPNAEMGSGGAQTMSIANAAIKTPNGGLTFFAAGEGIFAADYCAHHQLRQCRQPRGWTHRLLPGRRDAEQLGPEGR